MSRLLAYQRRTVTIHHTDGRPPRRIPGRARIVLDQRTRSATMFDAGGRQVAVLEDVEARTKGTEIHFVGTDGGRRQVWQARRGGG